MSADKNLRRNWESLVLPAEPMPDLYGYIPFRRLAERQLCNFNSCLALELAGIQPSSGHGDVVEPD
jgi:hypothetical protein